MEVLSDITSLDFSPGDCLTAPGSTMASCTQHPQAETISGNDITREATHTAGARYVDVTPIVCRHDRCPPVIHRMVAHRDPSHISQTWSRGIASELGRRLHVA